MADRLSDVPLALRIARSAVWRIRISLAWAFGYNTIGLALAAAGLLSPVFAATSMILSSLIVTAVARGAGRPADEPLPVDAGAPAGAAPPAGSIPVEV
jgi:cation transport ATPase